MFSYKHLARVKGGTIVTITALLVVFSGKWPLAIATALIFWWGTKELVGMARARELNLPELLLEVLAVLFFLAAAVSKELLDFFLGFALLFVFSFYILRTFLSQMLPNIQELMASIFCLLYTGWLPAHFVLLRYLNEGDLYSNAFGLQLLSYLFLKEDLSSFWTELSSYGGHLLLEGGVFYCLITILSVMANDTAAYYFGKSLGKSKLNPAISPKKTVVGAVAGIIAGTAFFSAGSIWVAPFFDLHLNKWLMFSCGFFFSLLAQIGDLLESLLKRAANLKDSGQIIEGQGGVLDRFDSHILIFIASFYVFSWAS